MKHTLPLALALSLAANSVFAHAALVAETPAADAAVTAPAGLSLTFAEAITLKFSGIVLKDAAGKPVATGAATLNADGTVLTVPAALTAGTYTVDWHNLSDDGHKSQGSYNFTVK